MSAFPTRCPLAEFLKRYDELPSDDDDDDYDLREDSAAEDDGEDDQPGDGEDLADFIAEERAVGASPAEKEEEEEEEDAPHKAFDAALRDAEKEALELLAKSFEAKAAGYLHDRGPRESHYNAELRAAARAAKLKAAEAEEAALAAEAAAAAKAAADEAQKMAVQKAALDDLYALYAEGDEDTPRAAMASAMAAAPTPKRAAEPAAEAAFSASSSGTRYRIKKKPKLA